MKMSTLRKVVAGVVVLCVAIGLVVHTGLGTPSAFGWRDIAAICPVGALEIMAGAKAFLIHPALLLVGVLIVGALVGKAFCSWVCPVPHIERFFHPKKRTRAAEEVDAATQGAKDADGAEPVETADAETAGATGAATLLPEKTTSTEEAATRAHSCHACGGCASGKTLPPIGGKRDGIRIDSRHATLVGAVASSFAFGFPVFCLICPVGLTFAVLISLWNLFRFNEASWGLLIFPAIILLEVVFFRKWCTKFCPISAVLSLVSAHSKTLRPLVNEHTCLRNKGIDCTACVSVCPEGIDPHSKTIPECSRCGECLEACPAHALTMPLIGKSRAVAECDDATSKKPDERM